MPTRQSSRAKLNVGLSLDNPLDFKHLGFSNTTVNFAGALSPTDTKLDVTNCHNLTYIGKPWREDHAATMDSATRDRLDKIQTHRAATSKAQRDAPDLEI